MKTKILGLLAVGLLAGPPVASAAYVYDFSFDAVSYNGIDYAADGFSFETAQLLNYPSPLSATGSSTGDLNGFSLSQLQICAVLLTSPIVSNVAYCQIGSSGGSVGDVVGFWFTTNGLLGIGTFTTNIAGREIRTSNGSAVEYTSGSLTIREVPTSVPEPGTLALLGLGLAGLGLSRRRKAA